MVDRDGCKGLLITNSLENGRENGKTPKDTELFFFARRPRRFDFEKARCNDAKSPI
jgi:hypothetical protein